MPINRGGLSCADTFQFAFNGAASLACAQQQVYQREQTAEHVHAVHSRKQIEERAVRVRGHVEALSCQISPRRILRANENYAQDCGKGEPPLVPAITLLLQRTLRNFYRNAAD